MRPDCRLSLHPFDPLHADCSGHELLLNRRQCATRFTGCRPRAMIQPLMNDALAAVRPRRSVLFMPGSNARALEKARTLAADALVLDLEDAVAPEMKLEARAQVAAAGRAGGYRRRGIGVPANALGTPWGRDDLAAAAAAGADALLLPKVEAAETVTAAIAPLGSKPAVVWLP